MDGSCICDKRGPPDAINEEGVELQIKAFAKSGGYNVTQPYSDPPAASIFELPDVSYGDLRNVLWRSIDWDRFLDDFVNNLLEKLGSFADDWCFFFGPGEDEVVTSQLGLSKEDVKDNELVRVQEIVLRKLKLCASRRILFPVHDWKRFCKESVGASSCIDYEAIDGKEAEEARKKEGMQDMRKYYAKLT
ncbi:hypothetical protein MYAM1_003162 [Malassezia yamatoensis]|uniref:Uncharacterized protein n=1 Tax=Malassezia yamatoensis TaxID=253288 RepID=A0AAJ5YV89_9BASI|nr:hypothetical protein MYAM1_003162 [Malassezia yamatoensis]